MDNEKRIAKLKEKDYQKYFGVTKETFAIMYKILDEKYQEEHKWVGSPSVLNVLDKLVIFLQYYWEYRTMEHIYANCKWFFNILALYKNFLIFCYLPTIHTVSLQHQLLLADYLEDIYVFSEAF